MFRFPLTFISPSRLSACPFQIVHITCNMYYILHVMCNTYSILSPPTLETVCQFVYRGTPSVVWRIQNNRSARLSQLARRFACQFVYRRILDVICRARNNTGPILNPLSREPMIQKVAKYGMRDPYMLYKISCPYFIKVHI